MKFTLSILAGIALTVTGCPKPENGPTCTAANTWHAPAASCAHSGDMMKAVSRVKVADGKIVILEKVQFEQGTATLLSDSHALLNEVAETLNENPGIEKVRVEGHTSSEGERDFNIQLSNDRANAVREYLMGQGIAAERLMARGFGPDSPIASNDTEEGRKQNRRVEFTIMVLDGNTLVEEPANPCGAVEDAADAVEDAADAVEDAAGAVKDAANPCGG